MLAPDAPSYSNDIGLWSPKVAAFFDQSSLLCHKNRRNPDFFRVIDFPPPMQFDRPAWLALVLLLPLFWWWGRRSLSVLGRSRSVVAFAVRSLVWLLLVAAVAELQWVRTDDRMSVIFLLDRSQSVPEPQRAAMIDFVNAAASKRHDDDTVGVVTFGRDARIEVAPYDESLRLRSTLETTVDPQYTNLADALQLAEAAFPDDAAKRIVVVSDGNQNAGDAYAEARRAADQGIGIDAVTVDYRARGEVLVEKVSLPSVARRGEPFDVQVLLNNTSESGPAVGGTLEIVRRRGDDTAIISREHIDLPPGKRPFSVRQTLVDADFYVYEATFLPDDPATDVHVLNNRALNYTQVEGAGRVLVIEDFQNRGRHERLVEALRREKLEVTLMPSNRLFTSQAELIGYDTVILADVPRAGGDTADDVSNFSDDQLRMLVTNVREFGCGLAMLGGPNSLGAGGWANTPVEQAMPVDFQIQNVKVLPSGALLLVLDSSGSMEGEKIDICRNAARAAVRVLSSKDYVGIIAFDSDARWVVPLRQIGSVQEVLRDIDRIRAGGGTNMQPALEEGYPRIAEAPAAVKHVIVMSDGHTSGTGFEMMAEANRRRGITTSAVAVGRDADAGLLEKIAQSGGGKFYLTQQLSAIPRIFIVEAKRVARPLIYENPEGMAVNRRDAHEVMRSVQGSPPPLTGFVLSRRKENPLVQTLLETPKFASEGSGTIAATWIYGLGRTAVWSTDCGQAWAGAWNDWPQFDALLTGLVRWTMRPPATGGRFAVHAEVQDGAGRIVVTAVDEQGEYLNLLDPQGTVVGPDLTPRPVRLEQTAPGRYAAQFPTDEIGSYFVVVRPGPGQPALRTGLNVSYSAEFRDRDANLSLLSALATLKPRGGAAGRTSPLPAPSATPTSPGAPAFADSAVPDFFRRDLADATGRRDLWPELLLAALVVFTGDVFIRRVAFDLRWLWTLPVLLIRRFRNRGQAPSPEYIERLRSRKEDVARSVAERRAATRLQPIEPAASTDAATSATSRTPPVQIPTATPNSTESSTSSESAEPPADDYMSRLRRAKKQVWHGRGDAAPRTPQPPPLPRPPPLPNRPPDSSEPPPPFDL